MSDNWQVVEVEQEVHIELKELEWLPPVTVSTKPDLVIEAISARNSVPEIRALSDEVLSQFVIGVSHKTEARRNSSAEQTHAVSNDTTAQWTIWNAAVAAGKKEKPMLGVLMNVIGKQKVPNLYRFFVQANRERAKEFVMARQIDWHLKAAVPPTRSGNCRNGFNRLCQYFDMCWDSKFPAQKISTMKERTVLRQVVINLADEYMLEPKPWAERPGAPTPYGMSRFGIINNCGMQHYLQYELELKHVTGTSNALEIGTAVHCLLGAHYRGHSIDDEVLTFRKLQSHNITEARRVYDAYCFLYGGDSQQVVPDSDLTPLKVIVT